MVAESRMLQGVVPVVQTPMTRDGQVDVAAQKRLIQFLLERNPGGFWCLGTGSEDMNLTFEQRLAAAGAVTEANAGRVPLILGAGFFCLDEIRAFMNETASLQFDAYHVMPYHPLLSLDRLNWFYRELADHAGGAAGKPLWLYTSGNWARPIPPSFVAGLKDHPNIAGVKYSSSQAPDQLRVIALADDRFQVITAVVKQFYACLAMGAKAGTTSVAGAIIEPVQEIYELFRAGRHEEALKLQNRFTSFLEAWPKTVKADNFLGAAEEKYILSRRGGICEEWVTSYYRQLTTSEKVQLLDAFKDHQYDHLLTSDVLAESDLSPEP